MSSFPRFPAGNRTAREHYATSSSATIFGDLNRIFEIGSREALRHGIPVVDAMHLAAAPLTKSVLVTNERPGKPLYRSRIAEVAYLPALTE